MPGYDEGDWCYAFPYHNLVIGSDLLVYARRIPGGATPDYFPIQCNTRLALNSAGFGGTRARTTERLQSSQLY